MSLASLPRRPRMAAASLYGVVVVLAASGIRAPAAEPADAVGRVVTFLTGDDADLRAIGLDRLRHGLVGREMTSRAAALLPTLPPARQRELAAALASRGDAAAVPALATLVAEARDADVRAAALEAVGRLGGGGEVSLLTAWLAKEDPERTAARRGLVMLHGAGPRQRIVEAARGGDGRLRATFVDILSDRGEAGVADDLVPLVTDADPAVRLAAARALRTLGDAGAVPALVDMLLAAPDGGERQEAERTLVTLCAADGSGAAATTAFLDRFTAADEQAREVLLPALGRIGGTGALAIIDGLVAAADPAQRAFGLRALTRWPDATVAARLLDLHGTTTDAGERAQLLAALIRIAPQPDNKLDDGSKLDLLRKVMELCERDEDRTRVLERANAIRTVETFRFVVPYLDDPKFAEPACLSVVELAHHQKLRDAHKQEFHAALDKVIATTKDPELVERANRYKEGKTWERKKG
jgi:HEAT repeat protein